MAAMAHALVITPRSGRAGNMRMARAYFSANTVTRIMLVICHDRITYILFTISTGKLVLDNIEMGQKTILMKFSINSAEVSAKVRLILPAQALKLSVYLSHAL